MAGKSFFKRNIGVLDRILRFCTAIFLIILGSLFVEGTAAIVLVVWGSFMLLTAFTGFCPAYVPFGISTRGFPATGSIAMSKMMSRCCSDTGRLPERYGTKWGPTEVGNENPTEVRNT